MTATILRWAERLYIWAHGWRHTRVVVTGYRDHPIKVQQAPTYEPPDDYPFDYKGPYVLQHAVNAQLQVDAGDRRRAKFGF